MELFNRLIEKILRLQRRMRRWNRAVLSLTMVVVFVTTYALILPALTLDEEKAEVLPGIEVEGTEEVTEEDIASETMAADSQTEVGSEEAAASVVPEEPVEEENTLDSVTEDVLETPDEEPADGAAEAPISESSEETTEPVISEPSVETTETTAAEENSITEQGGDQNKAEESATAVQSPEENADIQVPEIEEANAEESAPLSSITLATEGYDVLVSFKNGVTVPAGTELQLRRINKDVPAESEDEPYQICFDAVRAAFDEVKAGEINTSLLYELTFLNNGEKYVPNGLMDVRITYKNNTVSHADDLVNGCVFSGAVPGSDSIAPVKAIFVRKNADETEVVTMPEGIISILEMKDIQVAPEGNLIGLFAAAKPLENCPAASFDQTVGTIQVKVEAPEGAFPAGTTMIVQPVEAREVLDAVQKAVGEAEEIKSTTALDITFYNADGEEIQPKTGIKVSFTSTESETLEESKIVHIDDAGEGTVVESTMEDSAAVIETSQFSVYVIVGTELKKEFTLTTSDGEDVTYVVTVTYGADAQIPEGAFVEVTEFGTLDDEYIAAWNAVVSAKKSAHEVFDENYLGLAALDISIKDSDGNTIEPAEGAEVLVSIQMKELPKDVDESVLGDTMEVQHLNESTGPVAVETVAKTEDVEVQNGIATAAFTINSFSTFTITWSLPSAAVSDANASFRLRYQTPNQWSTNAYTHNVRVWYVDESGNNIQKPTGRNDVTYNANNYPNVTIDLSDYTALSGYQFIEARYSANTTGKPNGETIDSVQFVTSGNNRIANYIYNNETVASNSRTATTNNDTGNVYLVYSSSDQRVITVHYGYMSGGEFVEFDTLPDGAQTNYGPPAMRGDQLNIRYDIEGKDFVTVRMGNPATGTQISPLLQTEAQSVYAQYPYWKYRVLNTLSANDGINEWQRFGANEELYVIYRDTPTEKSYDDQGIDPADLSAPSTSKDVSNNGNGTYDISLSVTGQSNSMTNKTHANVVIVLDTSSSMSGTDTGTPGQNRLQAAKNAIYFLADELFGFNTADDPEAIEVAFVDFSHRVRNEQTKDTIYTGVVNGSGYTSFVNLIRGLNYNGGTNYDTAIEAANSVLWDDADPIYVIFITDGDTVSRGYLEYDAAGNTFPTDWDGGTYYNAAGGDYLARARSAAKVQVDKILSDSNNRFYSIGVFGNVQYLEALGGTYLGQANQQSVIEQAFAQIIEEIALNLGYEAVTIHDGITDMTATTLVDGTVDQFRYELTLKDGTKKEYESGTALQADYPDIGLAEYDTATKSVKWNLGEDYQLEDGVTYKVIFTVWPSQASYDLLAELNNGTKDFDSLDPAVKSQIIVEEGKYYLKTNTSSTVDYTSIKVEDGVIVDTNTVEGAEIKDPNGKMILDGTTLEMEKLWNDALDPAQLLELLTSYLNEDKTDTTYRVILRLWQDKDTAAEKEISTAQYPLPNGFIYKPDVTISGGEVTAATWPVVDVAIAPGVLVKITAENDHLYHDTSKYPRVTYGSDTYAMLETGHQYIITEDNTDLHFELNTDVYHPMVVDGQLKNVKFSSDGTSITEMSPENTQLSTLTATNDLKGGLEIHKIVTTKDDKSDTVTTDNAFFTFNIKLQKSASDSTPVYTTPEQFNPDGSTISGSLGYRIFASTEIPDGAANIADDQSSYEFEGNLFRANYDDGGAITGYTARGTVPSSGEVAIKIRQSDRIRLVNIPAGTYYTVEETAGAIPAGYELLDKSNDTGSVPANTQALAEFWNKRTSFTIELLKVDEVDPDKVLEGAEFELYESDGTTPAKDADGNTISKLVTGTDGKVEIGKLLPGTYILKETKAPTGYVPYDTKITIVVTTEKVTYQQGSRQAVDAVVSDDGLTWTITATNNAGVELPKTGGTGTLLYTFGGMLLIVATVVMYSFRLRRRERRLK